MRSTSSPICGRNSVRASASSSAASTVSIISFIDESGVRSSCDTLPMKSLRMRSAASSAVRSAAMAIAPSSYGCAVTPTYRSRAPLHSTMSRVLVAPATAARSIRSRSTDGISSMIARPTARAGSTAKSVAAAALNTRTRALESTVNAANGSAPTSRAARS